MEINEIKALLEKYRQGTCTTAETDLIESWLETVRDGETEHLSDDFLDARLNAAKSRIDMLIGAGPVLGRRRTVNWLAIAASFLILLSSAAVWVSYSKRQSANPIAKQNGVNSHVSNGWVYVQTEKGVTDHIKLPDGSMITLDASSSLRYPVKFTGHRRPIYLDEGEALFDVARDKTSPFTVYTPKFATTALGTAFNIRSYARENKVSISLLHGKIRIDDLYPVHAAGVSKILLPHQQMVLNKQSGRMTEVGFKDETPITAWKDGVLSFQDATMDEVINSIENRFNVSIKNYSTRTRWSYTGTFKDESVTDVLKTVCLTEGITCTINKNNITLN